MSSSSLHKIHFPLKSTKNNNKNITAYLRIEIDLFNLRGYGFVKVICPFCNSEGPYMVWTSVKGPRELECKNCNERHFDSNDLILAMYFLDFVPSNPFGTVYLKEPIF